MNNGSILEKCLATCQEIEILAARIYHYHADLFADAKQIAGIWRRTAREEEYHACQVLLARRLFDPVSCPDIDVSQAESTRNLCRALFETIRKSPPSLEEAFLTAIDLEEMLAQLHMDNALLFEKCGGIYLFRGLMMQDLWHVDELERSLRKLPSRGLRAA
jgi:hypothetical protein